MRNGQLVADNVDRNIIFKLHHLIDLVEDVIVVFARGLVGTGDGVKAHRLACLDEAPNLQRLPPKTVCSNRSFPLCLGSGVGFHVNHVALFFLFAIITLFFLFAVIEYRLGVPTVSDQVTQDI
jgi:hypothetical protein